MARPAAPELAALCSGHRLHCCSNNCGKQSANNRSLSFSRGACGDQSPWRTTFLRWVIKEIDARNDTGALLPIPISMHLAIILLAASHFLAQSLPHPGDGAATTSGAAAAISLLLSGILFMLTRRVALSQIIGFLTMENGIYLFALTQTRGMPMIVEMGIMLDVLAAVMIAGLIAFRIQKSFEHIDVTRLTELTEEG